MPAFLKTQFKIKHLKPTKWGWVVSYPKGLQLGKNVDIGYGTYIQAQSGVWIEEDVEIGAYCCIYSRSSIDDKIGCVIIKSGAKIGAHSTIWPGVKIGKNSIVGAHSMVTKSVPNNELWFGVPSCFVRSLT